MAYNYPKFAVDHYDMNAFRGPAPGSCAPDFDLTDAAGAPARLLDFDTEFLVLETGSITCPLFQGRRPAMTRLDHQHPDVSFSVLYVREAHPGGTIRAHASDGDKRACAARLAQDEGEARRILVDGIDGAAHEAYGGYPNAVFVINRHHTVVYFSDWNNPAATARALARLKAGRPAAAAAMFRPVAPAVSRRVLGNAGRGAMADFLRGLPRLIWANLVRRNLRLALGRAPGVAPDARC